MLVLSSCRNNALMFGFIALGLALLSGCAGGGRAFVTAHEDAYRVRSDFRHQTFVKQIDSNTATLHIEVDESSLLRKKVVGDSVYTKGLTVDVLIKRNDFVVGDTLRKQILIAGEAQGGMSHSAMNISLQDTLDYHVEVILKDLHRNTIQTQHHFINKYTPMRYVSVRVNGVPKQYCACDAGQELTLQLSSMDKGELLVEKYNTRPKLPPPPFSINSRSLVSREFAGETRVRYDGGLSMTCPDVGFMDIMGGSSKYGIPVFQSSYPSVDSIDDMMAILQYLSTSAEHEEMMYAPDLRAEFEEFWLDCGGTRARARGLIDKLYTRMEEADRYFTEDVAGWSTDRGLIHVIYGPPAYIMHTKAKETWYYGAERSESSLSMTFYHNQGRYDLDRSLDYRQSWYLMVDAWRNGRALDQ